MPKKNTKSPKRRSRREREEIVTEETETRVYPARKRAVVRTEPATLSEAVGEPVAVGPAPLRRVVRTRRVA
jgi:hypothetical protein